MSRLPTVLRRLLIAALLAGAGVAPTWAADPVPAPLAAPSSAVLQPVPGVEVQYDLLAPANGNTPGPARVAGSVATGEGRLRSSVRIDPTSERRVGSLDTSWETRAPGPLQTVVVGDTYASGAGWSQPARMTGLRFGRPLALRAPRGSDPAPAAAAPAFAASTQGLSESATSALLDAKRWLPAAPAAAAAPVPGGPTSLAGGASDYEVEVGRLRNGWDSADRLYQSEYAAAAYRAGLGGGLTAEARSEWTDTRAARGLEVLQDVGAGASLQAVLAQSAGTQSGSGLRWGMGVVRNAEGATWSLAYDTAERGFTNLAGAIEPRAGMRAVASLPLGPRVSADVSYLRQLAWDAAAPDRAMSLATRLALTRQVKLSFDVSVREGIQAGWRAGLSLSVPLDAQIGGPN
jgi:outer membrane usher protein FimD/PapC